MVKRFLVFAILYQSSQQSRWDFSDREAESKGLLLFHASSSGFNFLQIVAKIFLFVIDPASGDFGLVLNGLPDELSAPVLHPIIFKATMTLATDDVT